MRPPVGIVLVSHSAEPASGPRLPVRRIGSDDVPVATADVPRDGRTGTGYDLARKAVHDADRGSGVVVLPDLGSSVLTARTVVEDHARPDAVPPPAKR